MGSEMCIRDRFDSDKSSNDFLNVLAWGDQYFLTKEDSCRHHLDSIFQAELHQAGLPFQTAIRYTMTGKTTVSKPELNLSQMHLIEEKVYYKKDQSDEDAIWLQSYVSIPNSTLTIDGKKFKVGLEMVICSMLAWLVFFLTSSSCHPKIFIKEFGDFLMSCHQHSLRINLLVQR